MDDKRLEGAGETSEDPIPRDMPDEQAGSGSDHWDADLVEASEGSEASDSDGGSGETAKPSAEDAPAGDDATEGAADEPSG
ncbi:MULTISPECIES: hypothetical protein [Streptomyces]|uniref:Uncharacterized protein n=1 Tax=Streptomyces lichenis TaxID=2306967 RepID=A0ABT0I8Q7_9ACTN|nr:hypothetical protein [Streptomyces lichenis]MCK8677705.1 hypothetical protein [Streptomyces lichenis]